MRKDTEDGQLDDMGGEAVPSLSDSIPKFAQPAYGFVVAFIDKGMINRYVIWTLLAILLFLALPDNWSFDINIPVTQKKRLPPFFTLDDSD